MVFVSTVLIFGCLAVTTGSLLTPLVHVINGAFMERVDNVLAYDGSIPLIFQVELPHLQVISPIINCTAPKYVCDTKEWVQNTYIEMKKVFDKDFLYSQPSHNSKYYYKHATNDTTLRRERGLLNFMG